jgi:cytochrome c oxidase accessory protein FixG
MATHLPVVSPKSSLRIDGTRNFVYPADVNGRFTSARGVAFVVLIGIYAALPWIKIKGHPAVYLDIAERKFFLFGATFNSQDIWMTVFLLTGAAFGLVFATALLGRAWCGWACPQTVFLEGVYRRIERLVEGPREKRMRRSDGPWTLDKVWRKVALHTLFIATSLALAHVFLSYFVSLPQMFSMMRHRPEAHPEAFLVVMALAAVFYFNFAWFREQFCVVMCPYGRLQSVLLDPESLVGGYDVARGEPRGKAKDTARGACVDCNRCVVVCPTGIDIRVGLQMDCIACTQCIDACDEVMDKVHQPRGLIRYDSPNGLAAQPRRLLRPRVLVYTGLGALGLVVATLSMSHREPFEANVLRVQGAPYVLDGDDVRNAYRLHLINKEGSATTFHVLPEPMPGVSFIVPLRDVRLESLAGADVPIFATMPRSMFSSQIALRIVVVNDVGEERTMMAPFLGPGPGTAPPHASLGGAR